jgi:predicted Zn-dependent protease with MMP-like domain
MADFENMEELVDALKARYERFRLAADKNDYLGMFEVFGRLCAFLKDVQFEMPETVLREMELTWADLFWQGGRADLAAASLGHYLENFPEDIDARLQYAKTLFHSCQFQAASQEMWAMADEGIEELDLFIYLAALAEREGDEDGAREYYREAEKLDSGFEPPLNIGEDEAIGLFRGFLDEAPEPIREAVRDVPIFCSALPSDEILTSEEPPLDPWLLGLFVGPDVAHGDVMGVVSPQIFLFYKNIARIAVDREELEHEMRETLFHEIGHFAGMDEEQIRAWEHGEEL